MELTALSRIASTLYSLLVLLPASNANTFLLTYFFLVMSYSSSNMWNTLLTPHFFGNSSL